MTGPVEKSGEAVGQELQLAAASRSQAGLDSCGVHITHRQIPQTPRTAPRHRVFSHTVTDIIIRIMVLGGPACGSQRYNYTVSQPVDVAACWGQQQGGGGGGGESPPGCMGVNAG
eukprot:COSAG02_NODE_4357_length_5457_cov_4.718552_2_plen_115_part_00